MWDASLVWAGAWPGCAHLNVCCSLMPLACRYSHNWRSASSFPIHPLSPHAAACPSGQVACGSKCILASSQCCKKDSTVGLKCTSPFSECSADGGSCGEWKRPAVARLLMATCSGAAVWSSDLHLSRLPRFAWTEFELMGLLPCLCFLPVPFCPAGCPAGKQTCGSLCIDPTKQCCKSNSTAGLKCTAPQTCNSDGSACGELAASRSQPLHRCSLLCGLRSSTQPKPRQVSGA